MTRWLLARSKWMHPCHRTTTRESRLMSISMAEVRNFSFFSLKIASSWHCLILYLLLVSSFAALTKSFMFLAKVCPEKNIPVLVSPMKCSEVLLLAGPWQGGQQALSRCYENLNREVERQHPNQATQSLAQHAWPHTRRWRIAALSRRRSTLSHLALSLRTRVYLVYATRIALFHSVLK